jgi:hypothetical protein
MTACIPKCWNPVVCPDHGNTMNPWGRDAGMGAEICCDNYARSDINTRHLWSEHDSDRYYTDPDGWAAHEAACVECGPEKDHIA